MMNDVQAMSMLHRLAMHSVGAAGLEPVLYEICDVAMALSDADFGNVQLVDPASADLRIVAQRGFPTWWIDFWNTEAKGHGVCGSALETGTRVIVEDVRTSPRFKGKRTLQVQLEAGVRAVQSTPLVTRTGHVVGIFSTHYRAPHRPGERVQRWLDLLARQATDLIENTHVTAALRESEARFRALVTATSDIVYSMSPDWSQMRVFQSKGVISDAPQPSGDWVDRYLEPADRPQVSQAIRHAIQTKTTFDLEHRVRCIDGSTGWTHSRATPLLDAAGNIVEWFGASSDVTESRQAAAQLFDEKQRLQALLDALPVGVAFTNSPGCEHVTGNRALLEQFGASPADNISASAPSAEAHGRRITYLHEGRPVGADELPLQRAAREGRMIEPMELVVRLPDGKEVFLEISGAPIRNAQAEVIGAVTVSVDVSERRRAVEAREQARLKDRFLAFLGHELRNPMAAISAAIDLLKNDTDREQRVIADELLRSQVIVLKRLVDDLLDISHITLGTLHLHCESISLSELLGMAAAAARPAAVKRSQELVVHLPATDVHFLADRVRLQQVLANLLDNASKYSAPGRQIELSGELEGPDVVLRCRDNGRGIAPEARERIFDPLVRLDGARRAAPGGLGLGLALVRQLAQLHGGSAFVISEGPGMGSEFVVRIPFNHAPPEHAPAPPAEEAADKTPAPLAPLRTLLVDDHDELSAATAELLRAEGLEVTCAPSGREALELAMRMHPQLLLCDMGLPDIEGLALVDTLREQLASWKTYVAMVSARSEEELKYYNRMASKLGVDEFVAKPITVRWLRALAARLSAR